MLWTSLILTRQMTRLQSLACVLFFFMVNFLSFCILCNQLLVGRIPAAAYTSHGFTYDLLHKGIILVTYPQGQPPLHPAFNVPGVNDAWALLQDTRGKDQGTFRVPLLLAHAPEFPCQCCEDSLADASFGCVVHRVWV